MGTVTLLANISRYLNPLFIFLDGVFGKTQHRFEMMPMFSLRIQASFDLGEEENTPKQP